MNDMTKRCFFYWTYTVDLGFDRIRIKHYVIHPSFDCKLSISNVSKSFGVSPDCVTRSMPKFHVYEV